MGKHGKYIVAFATPKWRDERRHFFTILNLEISDEIPSLADDMPSQCYIRIKTVPCSNGGNLLNLMISRWNYLFRPLHSLQSSYFHFSVSGWRRLSLKFAGDIHVVNATTEGVFACFLLLRRKNNSWTWSTESSLVSVFLLYQLHWYPLDHFGIACSI